MSDVTRNAYKDRANALKRMTPPLVTRVKLYAPEDGGRAHPVEPGWGCPCSISKTQPLSAHDGWPLLGDDSLYPGEEREVGFFFIAPGSAEAIQEAGHFYLWEGGFIGEALVLT
jgi:hypothetical protein